MFGDSPGTGDGAALSGPEDHAHLHRLGALCDAVIVGAGTVTADDPRLTLREVEGDNPVRVVLDAHAHISAHAAVLTDGAAPTLWLVGPDADVSEVGAHVEVVRVDDEAFAPDRILDLLRDRGLRRVLVEGGGTTVSRFLAAGCLDRLHVTTVPVFLGEGVAGVRVTPADRVADAERLTSRRFVLGNDVLTDFAVR